LDTINEFLATLDSYLGGSNWFPLVLLGTGIFFTLYLKFPQLRFFRHATRIVTGKYEKDSMAGDTTHFQSLATALSGTVGTGNIGGVGLALYIGGPAALFWMWATAFFGMTTKFVECTLSHKYRDIHPDGSVSGGPMYYMEKRLNMKWLAIIFAIATVICSFGTGNMPQINNIATSVQQTFSIPPWITGAVLSVFLFMIIIGGIKRIAKVTEKVVPFMAFIYIIGAFAVILGNYQNIIPSFISIFRDAFTGSAAMGGFIGASFAFALNRGVNRGIYSNEAGQGSAAIAHSAAKADEPVSEGMVAILEPFIDTLMICTLTGIAILASGVWIEKHPNTFQQSDMKIIQDVYRQDNPDHIRRLGAFINEKELEDSEKVVLFSGDLELQEGEIAESNNITVIHARSIAEEMIFLKGGEKITGSLAVSDGILQDPDVSVEGKSLVHSAVLTTIAFKRGLFGNWGQYIVSIGLLLFAFSTVISWSYYGDRAVTYLVGSRFVVPYRVFYIAAFFIAALTDTTIVWSIAYVVIVLMAVPNLFGIIMLHKEMKQTVKDYWVKFKKDHPEDAERINVSELREASIDRN
jgi:AGCS family alanine or glycine:cation symporter